MVKMTADVKIIVTVEFDDDEANALEDQAIEHVMDIWGISPQDADMEIVGGVRAVNP